MTKSDLMILGGAAVLVVAAVWYARRKGAAVPVAGVGSKSWVSELWDGDGSSFGNGWRYFSDGTAIDPDGAYYSNGVKVFTPVIQ